MIDRHILIVDDEEPMRELLLLYLQSAGYTAEAISNGEEAIHFVKRRHFDLILLDLMLPGIDGFEVCRQIRNFSTVPIVMLSAREQTADKVIGLRIGADDYITKPFEYQELLARIETIFRREQFAHEDRRHAKQQTVISHNGLKMNLQTHQVFHEDVELSFTPKEFAILRIFLSNKGRVFHRDDILELVWKTPTVNDDRTVDTHIKNIREKLSKIGIPGQEVIKTVWGTGYICNENAKDK